MANGADGGIISAAMTAWRDALAARERMPNLFLFAIIAVAALNLVYFAMTFSIIAGPGLLSIVLGLIYAAAQGFLLTPLAIALHRFLLLDEISDAYRPDPQDPRFMKFFTYLAGLAVVAIIPRLIGDLLSSPFGASFFDRLISLVLELVVVVILVRNVILFPAVAVDAPRAEWQNAMADTKGHSWRVFLILLCALLPVGIVIAIALAICFAIPLIGWIVGVAVQAAFQVFAIAAAAAAASHLYAEYAHALGRPIGLGNSV